MRGAERFFVETDEIKEGRKVGSAKREAAADRAGRRERIATQLAAGMLAAEVEGKTTNYYSEKTLTLDACNYADALIEELDRRSSADELG